MSDKTEQPTPRRLRKAREKGDSPVSGALTQAAAFTVAVALVPATVAQAESHGGALVRAAIAGGGRTALSASALVREVLVLSVPLVAAPALIAFFVGMVQTGGVVSLVRIAPDLSRINPLTGIKNLFNAQRLVSLARALLAATIVAVIAVKLVIATAPDLAGTVADTGAAAALGGSLARRLLWWAAIVGLGLGGLDVLLVWRAWLQRNRMSKDEIKREHRESEGDPEIKAARRRAHQEMLAGATLAAVRNATVLVVNPTHLANALRYHDGEDDAPEVLAQGRGELALKMIDAARAWGVPVVRDVPLARALSELEVGEQIPEALYEAVAEVLREIYERGADE
jgi:flagellar biosynthesis protein FlhB